MRVAICCSEADIIAGSNRLAALLASSLKKKGFDVACVSLKPPVKGKGHVEFHEIDRWYTPKYAYPSNMFGYWETLFYRQYFLLHHQLKRCEKEFKPDFVINMLGWGGADVLRNINASKVQYVNFPFDLIFSPSRKWLHAPCLREHHLTLRNIHRVVCNSKYIKKIACQLWGSFIAYDKFAVIYPCVDWNKIRRYDSKENRPRKVCYIGRVDKDKGIDFVIDAFLKAKIKESELVIAGAVLNSSSYQEYYVQLKEKIICLRDKRIKLIENPSDEEIIDIYNSSKCFANFNPFEHFGMCVVEAMASGVLPIVADGGGQRETVINGRTGFRVSVKSNNISGQMAKFMRLLLTDDEVFNKMSMQAREYAKQFDKSEFIKNWIELLESK